MNSPDRIAASRFMVVQIGPETSAWIDAPRRKLYSRHHGHVIENDIPKFEGCLFGLSVMETARTACSVLVGMGFGLNLWPANEAKALTRKTPTLEDIKHTYDYLKGEPHPRYPVPMGEEEPPNPPKLIWRAASSLARGYATGMEHEYQKHMKSW